MQINPGKPNEKRLKSKVIGEVLRKGDVLRLVGAGGGGWGDAAKRDATLVARDKDEGFV
jgi:N-methylhydantoinase B